MPGLRLGQEFLLPLWLEREVGRLGRGEDLTGG